jgi:hypothetical protein
MAAKRKRKMRSGSGVKRERVVRAVSRGREPNFNSRKRPVQDHAGVAYLRFRDRTPRFPDEDQLRKYHELNIDKKHVSHGKRKAPPDLRFNFMEAAALNSAKEVNRLLVAASLKIKRVRRFPGWVLQRTYNHGKRPITII